MISKRPLPCLAGLILFATTVLIHPTSNAAEAEKSPLDDLPAHIKRITHFGQRADWSQDGKRILFIEKTYGDAFEVALETGIIRPVTHHFYHGGFTRALYLANGDILLSGCTSFDAERPHLNRRERPSCGSWTNR